MGTFSNLSWYDGSLSLEATLEQVALTLASYVGTPSDTQSLLTICGGGTILRWERIPGALPPAWGIIQQGQTFYIWFAGTTTKNQLLRHVIGAQATTYPIYGGYVNAFWLGMWNIIKPVVLSIIPPKSANPAFVITGHSYGAALALLAAIDLVQIYDQGQVSLLGQASPKALTEGSYAPIPSQYFRIQKPGDIVPLLPPLGPWGVALIGLPPTFRSLSNPQNWQAFGKGYLVDDQGNFTADLQETATTWTQAWRLTGFSLANHDPRGLAASLALAAVKSNSLSPRVLQVASLLAKLSQQAINTDAVIDVNPTSYLNIGKANSVYYGSSSGPLTPGNVDSLQLLSIPPESVNLRLGSNIQGAQGVQAMASGFWKWSAKINAGDYGKSTAVYHLGSQDINAEFTLAKVWAQNYSDCFGQWANAGSPIDPPSARSPAITYIRITDALNPRLGQLFSVSGSNYSGFPTGGSNDFFADFISTALSLRIAGTSTEAGKRIAYGNHAFLGIPDKVVISGNQIKLNVPTGGTTYDGVMSQYLNYLTTAANNLGFMGQSITEPKFALGPFTVVNGLWQTTLPGLVYLTGDRIRITSANARGFNGTWRITVLSANTFALTKGPPVSVPGPTFAFAQRVQLASGFRPLAFYTYTAPAAGWVSPYNLKVAKRNPAKAFTPVSFPRRARLRA